MIRNATAVWRGGLKTGNGAVSVPTGVLKDTPYSFTTRFEQATAGTSPEELVAAAHAGCYAMAFSAQLEGAGITADSVEVKATLTMSKLEAGWTTVEIHLDVNGKVPNADNAKFQELAEAARVGCPISRLLNTKITVTATLN